jgi:hypothetical protein
MALLGGYRIPEPRHTDIVRLHKRFTVVWAVVTAACGAVVLVMSSVWHSRGLARTPRASDVIVVSGRIFPEGTNPPDAIRGARGSDAVFAALPASLPPPGRAPEQCPGGVQLTLTLRDRKLLVYQPCAIPQDLQPLAVTLYSPPRVTTG